VDVDRRPVAKAARSQPEQRILLLPAGVLHRPGSFYRGPQLAHSCE